MVLFTSMSLEVIQFDLAVPEQASGMALVLERANAGRDKLPLPTSLQRPDTLQSIEDRLARPDAWAYAATAGEKVLGFAQGHPHGDSTELGADPLAEHLSLLMVDPARQGEGLASKLLDIVAARALRTGMQAVTLWTREKDNDHARAVYEHKGFSRTGLTRDSKYGDQVHYKLDLMK
jgi:GNAT superfamily N-acetyltransferase